MNIVKKIKTGDLVKIISGQAKGTTGKVLRIFPRQMSALVEGIGTKSRHIKPTQLNPKGGKKDIHVPIALAKLAVVVDEKSQKTSRVGLTKNANGQVIRVARQLKNREIK